MPPFLDPDSLKFLAGADITVTETSGKRQEKRLTGNMNSFTDNMNSMNILSGSTLPYWGETRNLVQSTITSASNYGGDFLNMNNGR